MFGQKHIHNFICSERWPQTVAYGFTCKLFHVNKVYTNIYKEGNMCADDLANNGHEIANFT